MLRRFYRWETATADIELILTSLYSRLTWWTDGSGRPVWTTVWILRR